MLFVVCTEVVPSVPSAPAKLLLIARSRRKGAANAARHHAVSCERAELGLKKRSTEEREVQAENARKRLHTERAADVHYGV